MNFKRINNITGWVVFAIASFTYLATMEASGSLWDCGEFASSAYKLQIPHPPGAPLFILLGRLFMIPFSNPSMAILGLNAMSALMSGFTILFLFWTITHFARKIVEKKNPSGEFTSSELVIIMAAGVVGALAYTFSDSFWYSAVESEVYASSSFFTALVFWAVLKWEHDVTNEIRNGITGHFTKADRWLILIFYLIGLSVGVHLLCILTIPAIVMVYYYKRYETTKWGTFWAFIAGCLITGLVQVPMIQWTIKLAGKFDILFTNSFGTPFFTGFALFFVFIGVLIYFVQRIAMKRNWNFLKLAMWAFAFVLLGFSTYFTTLIRSNANTPIDMFNVDNPVSLVGYLSREQYGDWPILKGQDFTAVPEEIKTEATYVKGDKKYEKKGTKITQVYSEADKHFFPRMWDSNNDQSHADYYASFAGIGKDPQTGKYYNAPTMGDNMAFFFSYQFNWMYWRYFMWNFAGRQNDIQGIEMGNVRDGNWQTGISFYDNLRLGDQSMLPDSLKEDKANNKLFALPFILGLIGLIFHYMRDKKDFFVTVLLFFFTGIAIVVYLNQAGNQPRERDYAYVGSFYAYAIWIGLGVMMVKEWFEKAIKGKMASWLAGAVCLLAVPVLMGFQEWDNHDRSKKTLAPDLAINYLESCAPNAILITFGDNDTYPLWFAQEVLGVRPDVRVINFSLLGTDWYINQLRYAVNESAPIKQVWSPEQIIGSKRDAIYYIPTLPGFASVVDQPMDLLTMMRDYAGSDSIKYSFINNDDLINAFPTKNVYVPVDRSVVEKNGTVKPGDPVLDTIRFTIPKQALVKNETAVLNIIAANNWERPICFTSPFGELGFGNFLRMEGMVYRLVPMENQQFDADFSYEVMMNKFRFGNAQTKGVYFDEDNRGHLNSIRRAFAQTALFLADNGKLDKARNLLERCDNNMLPSNMPYAMPSRGQIHNQSTYQFLLAAYTAQDTALTNKVLAALKKDLEQQVAYYNSLNVNQQEILKYDNQVVNQILGNVYQMEQILNAKSSLAPEVNEGDPSTEPANPDTPAEGTDN